MVEIKRLGEERWEDIRGLRLEALKRDPLAFCSTHEEEVALKEEDWRRRSKSTIFAVEGGRPVGMITLGFNDRQRMRHVAALYGVYVRKESRGQGIGRMLVEAAVKAISEDPKIRKIELTVNTEQQVAIRTYERCGFVRVGVHRDEIMVDGKYYDELLMEKHIK